MALLGSIRFGFDVGGVLIPIEASPFASSHTRDAEDTLIMDYSKTLPAPGALEAVAKLVATLGADRVFAVSRASAATARKTVAWMQHWRFFAATGFRADNIRFCAGRADKAPICDALGITHYVDDRLEVLHWLSFTKSVKDFLLFQPTEHEIAKTIARHKPHVRYVTVSTWSEVVRQVLGENDFRHNGGDTVARVEELSRRGTESVPGVMLAIDLSLNEGDELAKAWHAILPLLPPNAVGRRTLWRRFEFALEGSPQELIDLAKRMLRALGGVTCHLVLTEIVRGEPERTFRCDPGYDLDAVRGQRAIAWVVPYAGADWKEPQRYPSVTLIPL
jgi:hypothetical protein